MRLAWQNLIRLNEACLLEIQVYCQLNKTKSFGLTPESGQFGHVSGATVAFNFGLVIAFTCVLLSQKKKKKDRIAFRCEFVSFFR